MQHDKKKAKIILSVSLINAGVNTLLALIKIIVGMIGYSQALIADGIHSFSDLVSDALVFIAARASIQHPDKEHPYGHKRIETIGTLLIAFVLSAVAISIVYEAMHHFFNRDFETPTLSVIIVAIISIFANEALFHYSKKQGEKINSNLLISNAWHKRSDVFVSIIVLLSVIGSRLGWQWLDAVGAIIIAGFIIKMSIQMIWRSAQELIDRGVDVTTLDAIKQTIASVSGVRSIHQLRTRLHGNEIFVDLHIIVDPFLSVSEGHHIGEQVHAALLNNVKHLSDVTVHIDSENDEMAHPSLNLPNRDTVKKLLKTRWLQLDGYDQIQKMTLHYLAGHLHVEIFMPTSLLQKTSAEKLLMQYQVAAKDIPEIERIVIHYSAN